MLHIVITYLHSLAGILFAQIKNLSGLPEGTARTPAVVSLLLFIYSLFNGDSRL